MSSGGTGGLASGGAGGGTGGLSSGGAGGKPAASGGIGGTATGSGGRGGMAGTGGAGGSSECATDAECAGSCRICSTSRACVAATNRDDPNGRCTGTCDGSGACKSKKGQTCTATAGGCITGSLCGGDGYCCNQSCGTDATCKGTCAGRTDGSCLYPTSTCGTTSCSSTAGMIVDAGMCMQGMCMTPTARTCPGNLVCSSNMCKGTCSTSSDCVSGYYCAGTTCAQRKATGAVCAATAECATGTCSGRCCGAIACTCPQPSTGNLIKNAGFDTNLTGWQVDIIGAGSVARDSMDSDGCTFSGAVAIQASFDTSRPTISQCVLVKPLTSYNFGVRMFSALHCELNLFTSTDCSGDGTNVASFDWLNGVWQENTLTLQTGPLTVRARASCTIDGYVATGHLDKMYLTETPGGY